MADTNSKFSFYCPKCKAKDVAYEFREGLAQCDTPIGTVETTNKRAYCLSCGSELFSRELRNMNYLTMVKATMGLWRSQNPNGTKKQCRRALGLTTETVAQFWDLCMIDIPKYYPENEENSEDNNGAV